MGKLFFYCLVSLFASPLYCQVTDNIPANRQSGIQRPRLVVGIVVDQMRWDFLYRYYDRYLPDGGFRRLLTEGFSCENTIIPYTPTLTACGHSSIFTGSVPAIDGITGNDWWDYTRGKIVYCTDDDSAKTIGVNSAEGQMSPKNLLVSGIGDELNLATNFRSKVIGISLKDRGAILPAGHSANAAYWYSNTGEWISSSYYMTDLPQWVKDLNAKKLVDKYFAQDWNTLYPLNTYVQSTADEQGYETKPFGTNARGFPYNLKQFVGKNFNLLPVTPYGNSFTFDMANAVINGEQMGADSITDLLTISLSAPDYIGHNFGPNSVEAEDSYLRLDKDLGDFLKLLDKQVGKGEYLVMLTADHGAGQVPAFLKSHKIPTGTLDGEKISLELNQLLKDKFNADGLVIGIINYQVYLDRAAITKARINKEKIYQEIINYLSQQSGIARAFALDALNTATLNSKIRSAVENGYYPSRSGDIQLILQPQWLEGFASKGTTHGLWNPHDAHVPLLWFGWNIKVGKTNSTVHMTDIAPTIASMLHIQMPGGSIGNVIEALNR